MRDTVTAELILDALPEALILLDGDARVIYTNPAARRLFSSLASDEGNCHLSTLLPGLGRDAIGSSASEFRRSLVVASASGVISANDGERAFPAEISCAFLDESTVLVVLRDRTAEEASRRLLIQAHGELEEFSRFAVGRELRMVELKREMNDLLTSLGRPPRYEIVD